MKQVYLVIIFAKSHLNMQQHFSYWLKDDSRTAVKTTCVMRFGVGQGTEVRIVLRFRYGDGLGIEARIGLVDRYRIENRNSYRIEYPNRLSKPTRHRGTPLETHIANANENIYKGTRTTKAMYVSFYV
jgi:hypothetical protein